MNFKETGFRPFYHQVCALELNDKLCKRLKNCPDIDKSSHAVVYGYIDPEKGLMLEVLGVGKQAPKYFYFKDPYEGRRISISISDVADVPFLWFEKLEPRFQKKFAPRIGKLKQYDASESVEESRTFDFLDGCREPSFPDDVRVLFNKEGLKSEECWVRITGIGDHVILGKLLNQPYQNFGVNEGDTIKFAVQKQNDEKILCVASFADEELSTEDLEDGTVLKGAIADFHKKQDDETFGFILAILRSSNLIVPCDIALNEEAQKIFEKCKADGKDISKLTGKDADKFHEGMSFHPIIFENDKHKCVPAFSSDNEIGENIDAPARVTMPFLHAMQLSLEAGDDIAGIVVNPFTQAFVVDKELFGKIAEMKSIVEEESDDAVLSTKNADLFGDNSMIRISVGKIDVFNYALYHNNVPPIRDIKIQNLSGNPINGLSLRITSNYDFFMPYDVALPTIPSGKPIKLEDPNLIITGKTLADLTESVNAVVTVEICMNGKSLCGQRGKMTILAYDQWQGYYYLPYLPAFIMPNHPAVSMLLHDAAERLSKWGKNSAIDGYQAEDPNRVRELAAATYAAIQKKNIVYATSPANLWEVGQRIRTPEMVFDKHLGNCMDMTLLYAACLEAMGLHPVLVLRTGHIYAGVWLRQRSEKELMSESVILDSWDQLTKRINNGTDELTFVECTAMCGGANISFEEAEKRAKFSLLNEREEFECAIDVFVSRLHVKPVPSRVMDGGAFQIEIQEKDESEITAAPEHIGISIAQASDFSGPKKITSKKELWESKLLDLSQHNMLLDLPLNASIEPIMSSHIDELEDALADGHEFHLLPVPEWIASLSFSKVDKDGKESKPKQWLPEAIKELGVFELTDWPAGKDFDLNEKFRQEFRNHRVYTFCGEKQLERELTTLYRTARSSQQENGVSSLYLAIGLLRWFALESETPSYAPLILLPIEIIRKSANQGYALHARDEEPHFNTTLLEMLKQNYNLEIGGLEPLPSDEHGIHIKKVFSIVRSALFTVKNWDVVESCVIGNFSFAQFAMWNDIHTSGDTLDNSNVVRSLMKGHVDWDASIPESVSEEKVYLPITVDATQLKAIKMASHGLTFVLQGPPGTGKSQTITGMIANLMAQGKTVLFVAEKMAALSVVQRRLSSLGIGDFCLELHSNKANKKQVLSQLEKALVTKSSMSRVDYEAYLAKTAESRARLDEYVQHLHKVHNCGYSLHELIDLYESVGQVDHVIDFDIDTVDDIPESDTRRHVSAISKLIAAGSAINDFSSNPLMGVGLAEYSAEVRRQTGPALNAYMAALNNARAAASSVSERLGSEVSATIGGLSELHGMIHVFQQGTETEPLVIRLLAHDAATVSEYYNRKESLEKEKQGLLATWKEDFLQADIPGWREKHTAAGKKFFGKAAAMAGIVSDLQVYANTTLSYEQIPGLLELVERYQKDAATFTSYSNSLPEETGILISQLLQRADYEAALAQSEKAKVQAAAFPGGLQAILEIAKVKDTGALFKQYQDFYEKFTESEKQLNELLHRDAADLPERTFDEELAFCEYVKSNTALLKDWALYNQARSTCVEIGLMPVVEAFESGMPACEITAAYQKGFYYALITNIISTDDVLSTFSGATFNESIQQFKRLDDSLLGQTRSEIYHLLAANVPSAWDSPEIGMELNLLRKAIGSNARGMSIRALFEKLPHVLKRLAPCMLMSPNSVAQYLAQDNNLFDIVIFDEASQLPTCKAVGALMRAKNAVIVGDPKQMPPTSFFAGGGPEIEDIALDDLDSILEDALALGIPSQHLQWHYRSTHESLIAFSNSEFYDNKMFTFPSANDRERHVTAVYVNGGMYQKGTNVKEAEAVVAEIVRRFRDPALKGQSIGVVTFNVKQQALIENLLTKQFEKDTAFDAWVNNAEDPLFVKNLENVQGDERDVILFSIGYGPDEKGHISMNFGPINKDGGGKRLNVAFSRARVEMKIFSSMHSSDIKVTDSSPDGVRAFHDFLYFAEGYGLANVSEERHRQYREGGILKSICDAIISKGYQCETMVGHSDFHVDIAVVDPYEPTQYLMGIMLDGEGYKRTRNTRDREIAQIGVLKNLGWQLRRVWTIDWWDNREKEIRNLIAALDALKEKARIKAEKEAQKAEQAEAVKEEAATEAAKLREELKQEAAEVVADEAEAAIEQGESKIVETTASTGGSSEAKDAAKKPVNEDDHKKNDQSVRKPADSKAASSASDVLFAELLAAGATIIDKRSNGGALWVVGGKNLTPIMKKFQAEGVLFVFKAGGGKATGSVDGWWSKTDIRVPEEEPKAEPVETASAVEPSENTKTFVASTADISDINETAASSAQTEPAKKYVLKEYAAADIEPTPIGMADFTASSNKTKIGQVAETIVETEGPMLKEVLYKRLFAAFGLWKSNDSLEAAEKAIKSAKIKTSKLKGSYICWASDQDPKDYMDVRTNPDRTSEELTLPEVKNAICFVLQEKDSMSRDDVIKEASRILGYKRLGKNLEAALDEGLRYARSNKEINVEKGICSLNEARGQA